MTIKQALTSAGVAIAASACISTQYLGADFAPEDLNADDLTPLAKVERGEGGPVMIVDQAGAARLTIVRDNSRESHWAAQQLQETILEMTGAKLAIVIERENKPVTNAPALYIGKTSAAAKNGLKVATEHPEAFGVVTKAGSVYFIGRCDYAVTDWCERELGVRYYWPMKHGTNTVYGRCVSPAKNGLVAKPWSWEDKPVFDCRDNWPYEGADWNRWAKGGGSHRGGVNVHAPHGWWKEKDAKDHIEIFALSEDGKRPNSPLLCYGNPKTLEYYKMRTVEGIRAYEAWKADTNPKKARFKDPTGGILAYNTKVVTISQWDCGVYCACEHCKKLFNAKLGGGGSGSPIIWGYFTKQYAKWLKEKYPDWKIAILPYCNTCDVPPDPEDPTKKLSLREEGNVEAMLCTMPGVAMMKNQACKQYEEALIREWVKCTGNPVLNWHYSCWPAEFTSAPYVYGETIKSHYQSMRNDVTGSFLNGGYDVVRFSLSVYVWMRCLWNPDVDVQAIYDEFAKRMFGAAAKPMRKLIAMQEEGWNRQWGSNMCSQKNIFEISYPRKEVLVMEELLNEAKALAAGDEKATARIAWYRSGFNNFLAQSEQNASGTAFEPLNLKKVTVGPKLDGKLDDDCWNAAEKRDFVAAQMNWSSNAAADKGKDPKKPPKYASEVKAVWVPSQGVTFGLKFAEPNTEAMKMGVKGDVWDQDMIEVFVDYSGSGDGNYNQILSDAFGRVRFAGPGKIKGEEVVVKTDRAHGYWTMEVFVPFSAIAKFPNARTPTTSANGVTWTGNFCRFRCGDMKLPKEQRQEGSITEISRLNTRFSKWNKDPAAFSTWQFVE